MIGVEGIDDDGVGSRSKSVGDIDGDAAGPAGCSVDVMMDK